MGFTNSSLVGYKNITSNKTTNRKNDITRITPHCIVGQWTAKTGCDYFANTDRQVSSNYVVGSDGVIGLSVDEKDRSWCSSNADNDNRAITIECASDATAPYAFKTNVYEKLIDLCADICKRNGKTKLLWFGDKTKTLAYTPAANEMVLTVHRWFAAKSCPGDWMYAKMGDLASQVTNRLSGTSSNTGTTTTPPASTSNNESTIWNFLKAKGLNDYAIAGVMGNLYAESGLLPNNLQNTYNTKLGVTDAVYTANVDSGSYTKFVKDSAGYGLAQWTYWSRKQNLLNYAKECGKSIGDLQMQLEFLWKEMQGYTSVMSVLKAATSVKAASDVFLVQFERPADQSDTAKTKRAGYGQTYYNKYAGASSNSGTTNSVPYTVKVNATELNIRKGPGTNYATNGSIKDKGVYTIVQESTGAGATLWGKLKSGAGWISLDYCTKR